MNVTALDYELDADLPLTDPAQDTLGYAPFAQQLAKSVTQMASSEGLVLAIYGPWGSGKTTAINFIQHYLNALPTDQKPYIVPFNPWWFSGQEDLTLRFFSALNATLRASRANNIADKIADFADLVSDAPLPWWAKLLGRSAKHALKGKGSLDEKRNVVEQALKTQERNIVVILDDLDRLTAEEIRQIFRLIKAVANFPKTIYLLAFDRDVVIQALGKSQEVPGDKYLEKIVQVPFELPIPDRSDIWRLFTQRLDQILIDVPQENFDNVYWGNIFHEGIAPFLSTPRDVVRLINALRVTYPAVHGEVNPVDFVAVETLRIFVPSVYDAIRQNSDRFAGQSEDWHAQEQDREQAFLDSMLETVAEQSRTHVKDVLVRLFPKLESVWGNTQWGHDWLRNWRRELRVCSPDCFPVYFRLALPTGAISAAEMKAALALLGDPDAFAQRLLELANEKRPDGRTRVSAFLERLTDFTENQIPDQNIPNLVRALFKAGDQLIREEDESRHIFDIGNNALRIGWVLWPLLRRLSPVERFEALKVAVAKSESTSLIVFVVSHFGHQLGKYTDKPAKPDDDQLVNTEQLEELERLALAKIRDARDQGRLLDSRHLPSLLAYWREWAGEAEVRAWAEEAIREDEGLVRFLTLFVQKGFSQGMGDAVGRIRYSLDPKSLEPYLTPEGIIDRVKDILEKQKLDEQERQALECFIDGFEKRQAGKDPDSLFDV